MDSTGPSDRLGPKSDALKHLRRLSGRRRARRDSGQFVIDGPTLVSEALRSGVRVIEVYAEPDAPPDVVAVAAAASVPVRAVASGALGTVTDPVTPQPVAALAEIPADARPALDGLVLVLAGVSDPGNAGTLVRVAEAAGASAVLSCADAVDLWSPKTVRASAGSVFRVPTAHVGDAATCLELLRAADLSVVVADMSGERAYDEAGLTGDVALVVGNEAHGVDGLLVAGADVVVTIPMAGEVESLNAAMSGSVLAFESARQRRHRTTGADPST